MSTASNMAHRLVFKAIKADELQHQPCEICAAAPAHAHHDDYSKPLKIRWLCPLHHTHWHRVNGVWDSKTQTFKPWKIRPAKVPKTRVLFYLPPDLARRLEKAAAAADLSQSTYVAQALKDRFKKEGIE